MHGPFQTRASVVMQMIVHQRGGGVSFLLPPTWEELAGVDQQKISADICFEASWTHSLEEILDLVLLTQLPLMNGFSFTNDSFNTFLHVQLKEIG